LKYFLHIKPISFLTLDSMPMRRTPTSSGMSAAWNYIPQVAIIEELASAHWPTCLKLAQIFDHFVRDPV